MVFSSEPPGESRGFELPFERRQVIDLKDLHFLHDFEELL